MVARKQPSAEISCDQKSLRTRPAGYGIPVRSRRRHNALSSPPNAALARSKDAIEEVAKNEEGYVVPQEEPMAETLDLIAKCRAALVAELERTHSQREIRHCQHVIECLDAHPLITGRHKDIYEAVESAQEGITTEALRKRFWDQALAAIDALKQDWIRSEPNGRWVKVLPEVEADGYHRHLPPSFVCPV
jgi:CO dehydrogenase/acetyl-CoA synthase alpha subunit